MTKVLIAYYSWSGNTAKVASALAKELSGDLEEIKDANRRSGLFAFFRAAMEASRKDSAPIMPSTTNVADYDMVILGCPVWAHNMASPMRSYILSERGKFRQLALFCTLNGSGGQSTLEAMGALSGRRPIARLQVAASDIGSGKWRGFASAFAQSVRERMAQPVRAPA